MPSFLHPLSRVQGGLETLWGDLTFCHQADYVSRRFSPPQIFKKHTHTNTHWLCNGIRAFHFFSSVYGSVTTGQQGRKTKARQN